MQGQLGLTHKFYEGLYNEPIKYILDLGKDSMVAVAGSGESITVLDLEKDEPLMQFKNSFNVNCMELLPNKIAIGGASKFVNFYDPVDYKLLGQLEVNGQEELCEINCLKWLPEKELLIGGLSNGSIFLASCTSD